ncbi:hypothetical protein EYF80_028283 [Liparis tanakae]|uniref:Uncharacterized protein n=1 Tax=Liparis tanakae TaxID=230148 RepID=A0A4Z2H6K0_9TELE|nr:hypothetical protein EYF80_028283 [Liparis tanakae]
MPATHFLAEERPRRAPRSVKVVSGEVAEEIQGDATHFLPSAAALATDAIYERTQPRGRRPEGERENAF